MSRKRNLKTKLFTCSSCGQERHGYIYRQDSGNVLCRACYVHDLSTPQATAKKQCITRAIWKVGPDLSEEKINDALEQAAGSISSLDAILRQLRHDSDLFQGSS